ncbi:MAG TPA: V-type ATP synthase subunit E [Candidatus Methanoperedenaceae archaeon]|nr:V-type ATP synthase subunit E [Candidatus Methanoperedenaceae archaeon]
MGLEEIVKDIADKGKSEADRVNEETARSVKSILDEAESQVATLAAKKKEEVARDVERLKKQEMSSANLEVKRVILNARKDVLDAAFAETRSRLANLPPERNVVILQSLLKLCQEHSRVYSSEKDATLIRKIAPDIMLAGTIDCIGGIIIESADATVRLDYTYDTMIKGLFEQSQKKISELLFG